MAARRSRHLSSTAAHFADLENVVLIMEGAASWTAYRSLALKLIVAMNGRGRRTRDSRSSGSS
jgi:hypothetical protein